MTNNDYYADKVYVYKYGDPMIEETVRMLIMPLQNSVCL